MTHCVYPFICHGHLGCLLFWGPAILFSTAVAHFITPSHKALPADRVGGTCRVWSFLVLTRIKDTRGKRPRLSTYVFQILSKLGTWARVWGALLTGVEDPCQPSWLRLREASLRPPSCYSLAMGAGTHRLSPFPASSCPLITSLSTSGAQRRGDLSSEVRVPPVGMEIIYTSNQQLDKWWHRNTRTSWSMVNVCP